MSYRIVPRMIDRASYIFSWISTLALFLMMTLTFCDVLGRYLFKTPIVGTLEISEQLMVVVVFCALGQVTRDRLHIRADILNPILSRRKFLRLSAVCFTIAAVPAFFMAVQTSREAWKTAANFKLTTQTINLPIAPFYVLAALGLILLFFEIVLDIGRYIREAKSEETEQGPQPETMN